MTPVRRFLLILLLAFGPVAAFVPAQAQTAAPVPVQAPAPALPPVTAADRVLGLADAPVTVVEYASFVCSHCGHWQADVFPAFKARFIDTGRVKLVFRDLPTQPQDLAMAASLVGRCAAPGKFFPVAAAFFAGQTAMFAGGQKAWFDNAVAASGLTEAQMQACFQDKTHRDALTADVNAAIAAGVDSTPSFFVNGRRLTGDPTIEALATAIAAAEPRR